MIKVTRTFVRPSLSAPWHIDVPYTGQIYNAEFTQHVANNYKTKMHYLSNEVSADGLTLSFESLWETVEDYQTYLQDPICVEAWARRDQHNESNSIISNPSVITEIV